MEGGGWRVEGGGRRAEDVALAASFSLAGQFALAAASSQSGQFLYLNLVNI